MSGQLPTTPGPKEIRLQSTRPTLTSSTINGRMQARIIGSQKFMLSFKYSNMARAQFMIMYAFLLGQEGNADAFTVIPSDTAVPQGSILGTPIVSGASQVGTDINLSGFTPNESGLLLPGDVLKFDNHSKVYTNLATVNSDVSGNATVVLNTPVVASPADLSSVTVENVPFTVKLLSNKLEYVAKSQLIYDLSIDMMEDF